MISLLLRLFISICIPVFFKGMLRIFVSCVCVFFSVFTSKLLVISHHERPCQTNLIVYSEEKLHP